MYELNEDSVRVLGGKLLTPNGDIIERPAMLVVGRIVTKVDNYNQLFKEMLEMEAEGGISKSGFELQLLNLSKYPLGYFDMSDVCYAVRRCTELLDDDFIRQFVQKYGNEGFLDWFYSERKRVPIQTGV